jgi:formylglycine-generating enzyme required for sulfatase activity
MNKIIYLLTISFIMISPDVLSQDYVNFLGMHFKSLEAGSFTMGSCNLTEKEREENRIRKLTGKKPIKPKCPNGSIVDETATDSEIPKHIIKIRKEFQIGVYEVTFGEFKEYLKEAREISNTEFQKYNNLGDNYPVVMVSWIDIQGFIKWLNGHKPESDEGSYRLPTEAEWEFACRAGSNTIYCFGDSKDKLGEYAWFEENSDGRPHQTGQKKPNSWGIYDMHGNVWEWVQDWFDPEYYLKSPILDPQGPKNGTHKVVRGGGCYRYAGYCRSAYRYSLPPDDRHFFLGFRLIRENY